VRSRLYLYGRRLIDFCVKHQAVTLLLMNQEDGFVLRNWCYNQLITYIHYKAKKAGIESVVS